MKKTASLIAIATGFSLMGVAIATAEKISDVTESRSHGDFERIVIDDAGVGLDVKIGDSYAVTLNGSEEWAKKITTQVKNNALIIGYEGKKKKKNFKFDSDYRITITMPKFTGLDVNGAVDAHISDVDSDDLGFEVNGAANIEIDGRCGTLTVELDGAGNFSGEDLKCEAVTVEINGAGNAEVYGSKSATLDINGIGNIDLYGNPATVKKDKSLFSNITIHNK
ncbi:GIN domain-containing protein [Paremcibacter congregatus]|uniref:Putative auto-transporter adhesin head GIN domain-containing protein n=1 Tax=Paremcibacter congregatus TaxID=2043170 RepID=A0A2G4YRK6_9PROT|nr:DUF2807 domain-containing protein [Paremcibacter congregatus]PHZ84969.1 hypothetical protein CRD36_09615 [Paremcibacter congregatus]QDE26056.1 hypothetical protein FIV45_01530 [Paremcibacter congregatus]